jgi:hypothetical protein
VGTRDRDRDLWSVIVPWERAASIASHTFSKWVPELRALVGVHPTLVLSGARGGGCMCREDTGTP